jgi:hypothetical protein
MNYPPRPNSERFCLTWRTRGNPVSIFFLKKLWDPFVIHPLPLFLSLHTHSLSHGVRRGEGRWRRDASGCGGRGWVASGCGGRGWVTQPLLPFLSPSSSRSGGDGAEEPPRGRCPPCSSRRSRTTRAWWLRRCSCSTSGASWCSPCCIGHVCACYWGIDWFWFGTNRAP